MIHGIGIDAEEIARFHDWENKSQESLRRVLSNQEIAYCKQVPAKSAERFAVRYAAREAFFKAYQSAYYAVVGKASTVTFLQLCTYVVVEKEANGIPVCSVDWQSLHQKEAVPFVVDQLQVHLSLSHTATTAHAFVIIAS